MVGAVGMPLAALVDVGSAELMEAVVTGLVGAAETGAAVRIGTTAVGAELGTGRVAYFVAGFSEAVRGLL